VKNSIPSEAKHFNHENHEQNEKEAILKNGVGKQVPHLTRWLTQRKGGSFETL
jgi:hypothetical protein